MIELNESNAGFWPEEYDDDLLISGGPARYTVVGVERGEHSIITVSTDIVLSNN